jgi:hypothetical protein
MIDIPSADSDGPGGLRSHESTRPIIREFTLYLLNSEEQQRSAGCQELGASGD